MAQEVRGRVSVPLAVLSGSHSESPRLCRGIVTKGKSAIHLARVYRERRRNFVGQSFWARGYFVSTVGRDEALIRQYIQDQEKEDKRLDQLNLWS